MTLFASTDTADVDRPTFNDGSESAVGQSQAADFGVGESRHNHIGSIRTLTDDELEAHIADAGRQMLAAMARWEAHGCFSDRGEAGYWWRIQKEAIAARSPSSVARMEAERGIA